ncbi:alpha/beta fold hydrolase [Pararhodobacter oceanensis]|uniref:alpha/beta fold hydrolase n=1 Tax=Pararhodobacter oceanensis TaxID=2172121 RepID=UPI003A915BB1
MLRPRPTIRQVAAWLAPCFLSVMLANEVPAQTIASAFETLGAQGCETSELLCVTVDVPLDHFAPQPSETLPITYALNPASEESRGILVYVVGGPGSVGVDDAEYYLSDISDEIIAAYDIVFFDLRGVGPDHGISCPAAMDAMLRSDGLNYDGRPDEDLRDISATVDSYIAQCADEAEHAAILGFLGTDQAVRDLEVLRQAIGAPQLHLYGHSYGTEFVQEFASVFPEAVAAVILDSVVDPELTLTQFQQSALTGAEAMLARVLSSCDADAGCAADMGGPAAAVFAALQARLAEAPITIQYPLAEGGFAAREITSTLLLTLAFNNLYSAGGRAWFLRVLAAASQGDLVPLLRDSYYELSIDVETDERISGEDEGYYLDAYYAIVCEDWTEGSDADAQMARILAATQSLAGDLPRFQGFFFQELSICARMALAASEPRAPFVGGDYPTLVMNSSTDPITPIDQAYAVFARSQNAALIVLEGGPHVVWRLEHPCAERAMLRLLIDGDLPAAPVQICQTDFIGGYTPLSLPPTPLDPLWLARSVLLEMDMDLALSGYAMDDDITSGCTRGGTVSVTETDSGADMRFERCSYWEGIEVSGSGAMTGADYEVESLRIMLSAHHAGVEIGTFAYHQDFLAETDWISGKWNGDSITTTWRRE